MEKQEFTVALPAFANRSVSITEFGAIPNCFQLADSQNNANAINHAMKTISQQGGGTVIIPAGIWITGPIVLQSNVNLYLEKQALLKFSKNIEEYPLIVTNYEGEESIRTVSPITAEHKENIAISGYGAIDGSGDLWRMVKECKLTKQQWSELCEKSNYILETFEGGVWFPTISSFIGNDKNIQILDDNAIEKATSYYDFYRPVMISLRYCDRVLLEGVTFMNSPAWNIHPFFCKNLTVRNAVIKNPYQAQNGDGIDVESCKEVEIHHVLFETGDDAICIKAGKNAKARLLQGPCENIFVHDCNVNEGHGGFVIGSEMSRGVRNVYVKRCNFIGTDVGIRFKSSLGRGGIVENIVIEDINMVAIKKEAVLMTMSYVQNHLADMQSANQNKYTEEDVPYFRNILLENIRCMGAQVAVRMEPVRGRNETISNIQIKNSWFKTESKMDVAQDSTAVVMENTVME